MKTVYINRFDGGEAEDIRTTSVNKNEDSLNFDIHTKPHLLQPYADTVTESMVSGSIDDYKIESVVYDASGASFISAGQAGASDANLKFFYKSNISDSWSLGAERSSGIGLADTIIKYGSLAYALESSGSGINLIELTNTSTLVDRGTISSESPYCQMFVHPEDRLLYIGTGDKISRYDGTNDVDSATGDSIIVTDLLPTGVNLSSLTNYGGYLVMACKNNGRKAIAYLWDRDSTKTVVQGIVDFGEGSLEMVENINDVIIGVVSTTSATSIQNKLLFKIWSGGEVVTIAELDIDVSAEATLMRKAKIKDKVYFNFGNLPYLYVVGKNKNGEWFISKSRHINGQSSIGSLNGFSIIDDYAWFAYTDGNGTEQLFRTSPDNFTETSTYKTTINPNMPIADRYSEKQLRAVQVAYTGASTGTTVLKYSVDGSAMTTIISQANATGEKVIEATNDNNGNPFLTGREFQFQVESTGGAKIKEIKYSYELTNTTI